MLICLFQTFAQKAHLRTHKKGFHLKLRPFKCDICGKVKITDIILLLIFIVNIWTIIQGCADRVTLRKHVMVHTGEKPYECKHCGKVYSYFSTFKGVKKYLLRAFFQGFVTNKYLKLHEENHFREKNFHFEHCDEVIYTDFAKNI